MDDSPGEGRDTIRDLPLVHTDAREALAWLTKCRLTIQSSTTTEIVLLFLGALLIRLVGQFLVHPDPTKTFMFDPTLYFVLADNLAHGDGYTVNGLATAMVTPGYPALLAGPFFVFGSHLEVALYVNATLGALTAVLTYALAQTLFGRTPAVIAGIIVMVLPSHMLLSTVLLSENLATPLLLLALLLSFRVLSREASPRWGGALGLVFGYGMLTRGEFVVLALLLPVTMIAARRSLPTVRYWLVPAALAFVLVTGVWVIRNQIVMGTPTLATGSVANGIYTSLGPYFQRFTPGEVSFVDASVPPEDQEVESSQEKLRRAFSYARRHPLEELRRVPVRFWTFVRNDEGALRWARIDPHAIDPVRAHRVALLCDVFYAALLVVMLVGLPFWLRWRDPRHLMLAGCMVAWTALHATLFTGETHYHLALLPLAAVMASGGSIALWRKLRRLPPERDN